MGAMSKASLLLVFSTALHLPAVIAEETTEVVSNGTSGCTLEQKTDLVLLGLSLDEVNAKCDALATKQTQVVDNNKTISKNASDSISSPAPQPRFDRMRKHKAENFFVKFGVGGYSTSFLDDECSDCSSDDVGVDVFSLRFYSNSLQPGSVGFLFNWSQILPNFSAEYEDVDVYTSGGSEYRGNYSYSVEYHNTGHFIGLEYIFGDDAAAFYPGIAILVGTLSQGKLIFDCTEAGGTESTYDEDSYCFDYIEDDTLSTALTGISVTLYSRQIAQSGGGISAGLIYFDAEGDGADDETVNFSTTGFEISAIW